MRFSITLLLWSMASCAVPTLAASNDDKTSNIAARDRRNWEKYFQEAGPTYDLGHYDKRFYEGKLTKKARRPVLRDLIRSYLTTMNSLGIETWIAHGTLLGWWWNGKILPWDADIDVQATYATVKHFAKHMNNTRFDYNFTDPSTGERVSKTYLLDINPYYKDVRRGDGQNLIDGRWIDTATGMYVDITALRERDKKAPGLWSCKNRHEYKDKDLWPMRWTEFEGVRTRIPYNFQKALLEEYDPKALVIEEWNHHAWDDSIKEWVIMTPQDKMERYQENVDRRVKDLAGS